MSDTEGTTPTPKPVDLDRLAELEKAATPAPWEEHCFHARLDGNDQWYLRAVGRPGGLHVQGRMGDVQLIAEMRNALPALLSLAATCTCATTYATYEGPEADCPIHGAVRALNELTRDLAVARQARDQYRSNWDAAVEVNDLAAAKIKAYEAELARLAAERDYLRRVLDETNETNVAAQLIVLASLATRGDAPQPALHPHYTGTYCIHGLHEQCKRECKTCGSPCLCPCHGSDAPQPQDDPTCICTVDIRNGAIVDREASCPQHPAAAAPSGNQECATDLCAALGKHTPACPSTRPLPAAEEPSGNQDSAADKPRWDDGEPRRRCTYTCTHGERCDMDEPRPWHKHNHGHLGTNDCEWTTTAAAQYPNADCGWSDHEPHRWGNPAHWCSGEPATAGGAASSEPTCGAACPDIPSIACTYPVGHDPIPRDFRDLGVRAMDHGDESSDDNPRDVEIDVAVAYEQIRLAAWSDWGYRELGQPHIHVSLLLPRRDAEALRDLLDTALNRRPRATT